MYVLLHWGVLLVPGLCLVYLSGVRHQRVGIALGLSYANVIALVEIGRRLKLELNTLAIAWVVLAVALLLVTLWARGRRSRSDASGVNWFGTDFVVGGVLAALGAVAVAWAGPYLEVPSDVLRHLDNIQHIFKDLADGRLELPLDAGLAFKARAEYWFYLHAILTTLSGVTEPQALAQATIANTALSLVVVYGFARVLFKELPDHGTRIAVSVIATALFALYFGVNVFAWIRYYALAPAFLALPIYFVVMGMIISVDHRRGMSLNWTLLAGLLSLTAGLVHQQEAMFIFVIGTALVCALAWRHRTRGSFDHAIARTQLGDQGYNDTSMRGAGQIVIPWWLLAAGGVLLAVVLIVWSYFSFDKNPVVDGQVLELRKRLPIPLDLHIIDPSWKFYRTIGAFGVVAYIALILWWSTFRQHLFLVVAMLAPLLHVFNPVFADTFLRHSTADTLWRLCYTVPVSFVGALMLVTAWRTLRDRGSARASQVTAVVLLAFAFVTLGPSNVAGVDTWTRWQTLKPVPHANSIAHLDDLSETVRSLSPPLRVHTDPVTAYTLMAVTQADAYRTKFHRPPVRELDPGYYSTARLAALRNHILVVNLRDGEPSETGQRSGHWPSVITATSAYYSKEFLEFVKSRPNVFELMWSKDQISLYRIRG